MQRGLGLGSGGGFPAESEGKGEGCGEGGGGVGTGKGTGKAMRVRRFSKRPFSKLPLSWGKKKAHKHKQICGIVPGLGGWQNFVYVFFFGSFLMGEKNT